MLSSKRKEILAIICQSLAKTCATKSCQQACQQLSLLHAYREYSGKALCTRGNPKYVLLADYVYLPKSDALGTIQAGGLSLAVADPQGASSKTRDADGTGAFFNEAEVSKFSAMAADWWDPRGSMAPLHAMNPTRVKFCRQALSGHFRRASTDPRPFQGLKIADIGSGGGLLSESLARLGGTVTGVEPSREAVAAARTHAEGDESVSGQLTYVQGTAEDLDTRGAKFHAVMASEVIEHVPDPESFCQALASLSKPQQISEGEPAGMVVVSTLNRTPRSYAMAVFAAENLLRLLPRGTHDWDRFLTPEELVMMMGKNNMELDRIQGMTFNPFQQSWSLSSDLGVNYIAAFRHRQ